MILLASLLFFFFFNDTATTEIYTLSLHDALPIYQRKQYVSRHAQHLGEQRHQRQVEDEQHDVADVHARHQPRSEEHTSELQSHSDLVCRLLLEKKKQTLMQTENCTSPVHVTELVR